MKKILYTTTAFILCGIAQSQAACIATPSCTTLGYTETSSCDGGLKCPFGSYWYCPSNSGSGGASSTCKIGSILFSDKTCGDEAQYGKTPIGIVVYLGGGGGQALALHSIGDYRWGDYGTDISGLTNYSSDTDVSTDYASCENSKIIMVAGDKSKYPAVWAANEYSTEGTKAGDWCLPAAGIFTSYYNNQTVVNTGFERAIGEKIVNAWSSSEGVFGFAWISRFNNSKGVDPTSKSYGYEVRPVLEF